MDFRGAIKRGREKSLLYSYKAVAGDIFSVTVLSIVSMIAFYQRELALMVSAPICLFVMILSLVVDAYSPLKEYNRRFGPSDWRLKEMKTKE